MKKRIQRMFCTFLSIIMAFSTLSTVTFSVLATEGKPVITVIKAVTTAYEGTTAEIEISATGSNLTYQWQIYTVNWFDLNDSQAYQGTKSNHFKFLSNMGAYESGWENIFFRCKVTGDGGTSYSQEFKFKFIERDTLQYINFYNLQSPVYGANPNYTVDSYWDDQYYNYDVKWMGPKQGDNYPIMSADDSFKEGEYICRIFFNTTDQYKVTDDTIGYVNYAQELITIDDSKWGVNTYYIDVKFTVPAPTKYFITVINGKAYNEDGKSITQATEGTKVTLYSDAPPSFKSFSYWNDLNGTVTLDDRYSATTTFTMPAASVKVEPVYDYSLKVGGVPVTESNKEINNEDTKNFKSGSAVYTLSTNTLTLDEVTYNDTLGYGNFISYYGTIPLNIVVKGKNEITISGNNKCICSESKFTNLNISGDASASLYLEVTATNYNVGSYGIYCSNNIEFGGALTVECKIKNPRIAIGVYASSGNIVVSDDVILKMDTEVDESASPFRSVGLDSYKGSITINDATVTVKAYGDNDTNIIFGISAKESISINTGAKVTAQGEGLAMNKAPNLNSYTNYKATASKDYNGGSLETYNDANHSTYKYINIEPDYTSVTVSGTVTSYGSETDDVIIQLIAEGKSEPMYKTVVKGNSATYSFEGVSAGNYTMKVMKKNHVTQEYSITVGTTDVTEDMKIYLLGDIDNDGKVTMQDVVSVQREIADLIEFSDNEKKYADVDCNGEVNMFDVVLMQKFIAELITEYTA